MNREIALQKVGAGLELGQELPNKEVVIEDLKNCLLMLYFTSPGASIELTQKAIKIDSSFENVLKKINMLNATKRDEMTAKCAEPLVKCLGKELDKLKSQE